MFAIRCLIGKGALDGIKNVSRNTRISSISRHPASRLGFLELAVIRSWWGTYVSYNCSVSQDRRRIDSLHCSWFLLMLRRKFFQSSLFFSIFFLKAASFSILQFLGNFSHSFLDENGPSSPIRYTNVFSHVELDLHMDWLPIIVIFEVQAHAVIRIMRILNFFVPNSGSPRCTQSGLIFSDPDFHQEELVELLFKVFLENSFVRIEFFVSPKRMTPKIVPSTFLWHRLCNTDHRTSSLSVCPTIGFPMHAFFASVFFEKSEISLRSGSSMSIVSTVHRSDLVELLGLKTCVESGLGQIAKLLAARAEMRMPCACRTGKHGKNVWTSKSGMVSKWPSRNSKDGWDMRLEKARWRHVTHVQRTLLAHLSQPCVCDTHEKCAKYAVSALCAEKMCVQQVSVCTLSVAHTVVATSCVRNPLKKLCQEKNWHSSLYDHLGEKISSIRRPGSEHLKKILRLHILIFLTSICSISWLFINHCEWWLLSFPRHASLRDRPS